MARTVFGRENGNSGPLVAGGGRPSFFSRKTAPLPCYRNAASAEEGRYRREKKRTGASRVVGVALYSAGRVQRRGKRNNVAGPRNRGSRSFLVPRGKTRSLRGPVRKFVKEVNDSNSAYLVEGESSTKFLFSGGKMSVLRRGTAHVGGKSSTEKASSHHHLGGRRRTYPQRKKKPLSRASIYFLPEERGLCP